jgi:tetratricopeptide (TPR) repeat protein
MTTPGELRRPAALPSLSELLARFVQRQAASGTEVLEETEETGEVVLHQPSGLLGPDARTVLADALETASALLAAKDADSFRANGFRPPAEWSSLVRMQETHVGIPFCIGNFPQLVRDVTPLLGAVRLEQLLPQQPAAMDLSSLLTWTEERLAKKRLAEAVFGAALLRLGGQFEMAGDMLHRVRKQATGSWDALLRNEESALAWHRSDLRQAARGWAEHPQQDSPVILFNRGLTAMGLGQAAEATSLLNKAIAALPEKSAWHHLARLYRALNETL